MTELVKIINKVFYFLSCIVAAFSWQYSISLFADSATLVQKIKTFNQNIENRFDGSPGNFKAVQKIKKILQESNRKNGAISYDQPVFVPGKAFLIIQGQKLPIHTFYPNLVDLCNFEKTEFSGKIIDLKKGDLRLADGIDLKGALVLLDFDCKRNFYDLMPKGVLGFIFIEPETVDFETANQKILSNAVNIPRYQIQRKHGLWLRDLLSSNKQVSFDANVQPNRWEKKVVQNLWALIPGSDSSLSKNIIILNANLDTFHYCPELTSGGTDTLNLYLLVEQFKKYHRSPAPYSILFHFHNSSYNNHSGAAHLTHYSLAPEDLIFEKGSSRDNEEKYLNDLIREANSILQSYEPLSPKNINQASITHLIDQIEQPAGRNIPMLNPIQRFMDFDIFNIEQKQFILYNQGKESSEEFQKNKNKIKEIGILVDLFKKYGLGVLYGELNQKSLDLLESYRQKVISKYTSEISRSQLLLSRLEEARYIRNTIKGYKSKVSIGMNLTYGNTSIGLASTTNIDQARRISKAIRKNSLFVNSIGKEILSIFDKHKPEFQWVKDIINSYPHNRSSSSILYYHLKTAAFSIANGFDIDSSSWTSLDQVHFIQPRYIEQNMLVANEIIKIILHEDKLLKYIKSNFVQRSPNKEVAGTSGFWSTRIKDGSSLTLPETPLPNGLVLVSDTTFPKRPNGSSLETGRILPYRLYITDNTGRAVYHNIFINIRNPAFTHLFHFDKQGRIDMALDHGSSSKKFVYFMDKVGSFEREHFLAGIACKKADLYTSIRSSNLKPNKNLTFAAAGDSMIQDYSSSGAITSIIHISQSYTKSTLPFSVFFPKDQKVKLIFGEHGFLANVQDKKRKNDLGFSIQDLHRKSISELMASDLNKINQVRSDILSKNAITNNLITKFKDESTALQNGNENLKSLKQLKEIHAHQETESRNLKVLGKESIIYPMIKDSFTDMIKAVVFYLAVMLPFCFFLQKLLFSFIKIETQILGFVGLFASVYLIFNFIHPAFQISPNPQIIIISFTTLVLVFFVSGILRGKFDYHMKDFGGKFTSEESNVLKLSGKAFIIGVSNMRRRKIRTTLTCVTIILITFTMLSFTSVSQSVSPKLIQKQSQTPYNGIYFSNVIWQELDEQWFELVERLIDSENASIVRRSFSLFNYDVRKTLSLDIIKDQKFSKRLKANSVLGLESNEDGYLGKLNLISGRFFNSNSKNEIILTDEMIKLYNLNDIKKRLDQNSGDSVQIRANGKVFKVVGIIDGANLKQLRDLRGDTFLPKELAKVGRASNLVVEDSGEEAPEGSFRDSDISTMIIVPYHTKGLDLKPVSLSAKFNSSDDVWKNVSDLVSTSNLRFYFGCKDPFAINPGAEKLIYQEPGQYYLRSGFSSSFGGLSSLLIPLLVSATIIFNTMLSSVYERKKEIGIYNSIGLSPIHIGLFFIAESVVYGIVGSVAGYLIGQIFAKTITYFGLFQDLNINYSSMSVVYVILFTIFIVIASSLYPAWVAIKTAAASSGKRKTKIEDGNKMKIMFPFSFSAKNVLAIHSYIREYMQLHLDQSVGGFMATETAPPEFKGEGQEQEITYQYSISLAPFDLGVRQDFQIRSSYNKTVGAFMVETTSIRQAGSDSNWTATHRPFADGIRKYLLRWRALDDAIHQDHYQLGLKLNPQQGGV